MPRIILVIIVKKRIFIFLFVLFIHIVSINIIFSFTNSTKYIIKYLLFDIYFIILIVLIFGVNVINYKKNELIEKHLCNLSKKMNSLNNVLKSKEDKLIVENINSLVIYILLIEIELSKIRYFFHNKNNALSNFIDDLNELLDYLYDIKKEMIDYQINNETILFRHLNSAENDIFSSNIVFIDDYLDILIADLYPFLTNKKRNKYLEFAKELQKEIL